MNIACLDFEGVLVPEIWVCLAEQTNVEEFKLTTRDIADYDELMQFRLTAMRNRGIKYNQLTEAAGSLKPLPGALDFLMWLSERFQVAIISDTFHELAAPLLAQLNYPMILCHRLEVNREGDVLGYKLRQIDPKRQSVKAFQSLNYRVIAAGDSYNDISMLEQADHGMLFCPSEKVKKDHPEYEVAKNYEALKAMFAAAS